MMQISVQDVADLRDVCVQRLKTSNLGKRGVFDGNYFQQLFGYMAQSIVTRAIGQEMPECQEGPDPGYDVMINGTRVDVKCVMREYDPRMTWACNVTDRQINYQCDAYLFMSYNKTSGVFWVLGWVSKEEFKQRARYNPVGAWVARDNGTKFQVKETGFYELPIITLKPLRSWDEVKAIKV